MYVFLHSNYPAQTAILRSLHNEPSVLLIPSLEFQSSTLSLSFCDGGEFDPISPSEASLSGRTRKKKTTPAAAAELARANRELHKRQQAAARRDAAAEEREGEQSVVCPLVRLRPQWLL